jgi:hypothetical protein
MESGYAANPWFREAQIPWLALQENCVCPHARQRGGVHAILT